ncbi:MAG: YcaO-like family protein [Bdellovibrionales bacterium]|nr:YcaO-like family protein [Bdellovibrionales bacterium]
MKELKLNPSFYFSNFKDDRIVFWDNKNLNVISIVESQILRKIVLNGRPIDQIEELSIIKKLLSEEIIIQSPGKLDLKDFTSLVKGHNYLAVNLLLHEQVRVLEFIAFIEKKIPDCFYVIVDNFLKLDKDILSVIEDKKNLLFIHLKSEAITIGPMLRDFKEYNKYFEALNHTWTAKKWESIGEVISKAKISEVAIKAFFDELMFFSSFQTFKLKNEILSFSTKDGICCHEIIFSISTKQEKMNLKKEFVSCHNLYMESNGFRLKSKNEVMDEIQKYVDPIVGLADVADEIIINGIPVMRAFSKLQFLFSEKYLNFYSMGKGVDSTLTRISALAELTERFYSMINSLDLNIKKGKKNESDQFYFPNDLILYSKKQFLERDTKEMNYFRKIPALYKGESIEWVNVFEIFEEKEYWLPKELCIGNKSANNALFLVTSNGVAAGSSYLDAIMQGHFESIERDAASIWWYNELQREQLDLESIELDVIKQYLAYCKERLNTFRIIDITTDLETPCYVAVSYRPDEKKSLKMGFGCHTSSDIAITRAVTELFQVEGAHLFTSEELRREYRNYFENNNYDLTFLNPKKVKKYEAHQLVNFDIATYFEELKYKFKKLDLKFFVFNYTPDGSFFKVVRVIVPGLRTMMYELGAGRLYDVPVKMGHLEVPKKEEEMNKYTLDL